MPRMTTVHFLTGLFLILWTATAAAQQDDLLQAEEAFRLSVERSADDGVELRWEIADGYYMYREHLEAREAASGDAVALETNAGVVEEGDPNFGPSEVFYLEALARLGPDAPDRVAVTYQGCKKDSICYPPMTVTIDTANLQVSEPAVGYGVAAPSAPSPTTGTGRFALAEDTLGGGMVGSLLASGGTIWVIASFLVFGLLLAFTPCVLPMYPILSATLAREGEALTSGRGFALSSAYVLAMAAAFGLLGVVAAWSGQNLQMVLQSPYAIGALALLFFILAASMFGLFELQLPTTWVSRMSGVQAGRRGSVAGAAGMGFLSALIVGPCVTAPLAAALLYIAQTGDAALGASALFALGLGQGIPLMAFGTIGSRALPRAGAWMVQVKYAFGFIFLGTAIWMAARILPSQATLSLWAVFLLTAAVFIGVADRLTAHATVAQRFRKAGGFALTLGGVILAVGAASGGTDPLRPLSHFGLGGTGAQTASAEIEFIPARSTKEVEQAIASANGRPTFVYFTAEWCVICETIERDLLPAPEVVAGLDGFQRVKVDLTKLDQDSQTLMRELAVVGPPTMIFFDGNAAEPTGTRLIGDVAIKTLQGSIETASQ